jgi:hypothetical protein
MSAAVTCSSEPARNSSRAETSGIAKPASVPMWIAMRVHYHCTFMRAFNIRVS